MNWQPIETAPKDGTRVLIAWDDQVRAAYWDAEFEWIYEDEYGRVVDKYRGAWTDNAVLSFGDEEVREYTPTHWQPLPEPPQ